jgi:ribonuclease HIII
MEKGRQIMLIQREHAEDDPAAASASILAREAFLQGLASLSLKYRIKLPKGATQGMIETGREFIRKHGKGKLKEVAKLHFGTTQQVLG